MNRIRMIRFVSMMIILTLLLSLPVEVSAGWDPFVGQICLFPFNFAPAGWASCDGQLLPISQNTALFSLLGTTYGGDGKSTFALPNLNKRTPDGVSAHPLDEYSVGYCIALQGIFPYRP